MKRKSTSLRLGKPSLIVLTLASSFKLLVVGGGYFLLYLIAARFVKRDNRARMRGEFLRSAMVRLGPVYIKIGQILSTHPDVVSPAICDVLAQLRDDVPPMKRRHLDLVLSASYQKPLSYIHRHIFKSFDPTPIASASIAQVHRAALLSGEAVAVKIVKKDVRTQLQVNLSLMQCLVRILEVLPKVRRQGLSRRFQEIKTLLLDQADMEREKRNQQRMYSFMNGVYCTIPRVHDAYCSGDVLVMEYIDAIPGDRPDLVEGDRHALLRKVHTGLYDSMFHYGFVHGDPHPANIFYTTNGGFGFFDFGIVVELTEEEKKGLAAFMYACFRGEWDLATKRFTHYFVIDKEQVNRDYHRFAGELRPIIQDHHSSRQTAEWSMIRFLVDVYPVLQKYKAQYSYNFQKVAFMLLSGERLTHLICPGADFVADAKRYADAFSPYVSAEVKREFDEFYRDLIPQSLDLKKRAAKTLVAPTHLDRFFLPSEYPLFVRSAKGSKIHDVDGNTYIDLSAGYGPHILGHAHPVVCQAVSEQIAMGSINAMGHVGEIELAELIAQALPSAEKVLFSNSGTEAVIHALRLCRGYTGKDTVVKCEGHYHGFSDPAMVSSVFALGGSREAPEPNAPLGVPKAVIQDTVVLQYGLDSSLERIRKLGPNIACVLVEPMPTAMASFDADFLRALRDLCTEVDVPLVFDEVVTGFRVAYGGVQGLCGVDPDLTVLGKIVGGGIPCGAVAGKAKYVDMCKTASDPFVDLESKVFVGGTLSGNSVACAAGKAVLTYLRDNQHVYDDLQKKTQLLKDGFTEIAARREVPFQMVANRSMFSIRFASTRIAVPREMYAGANIRAMMALAYYMRRHGVYMPELHLMFLCSEHTEEDLAHVCNAFDESLKEMLTHNMFAHNGQ